VDGFDEANNQITHKAYNDFVVMFAEALAENKSIIYFACYNSSMRSLVDLTLFNPDHNKSNNKKKEEDEEQVPDHNKSKNKNKKKEEDKQQVTIPQVLLDPFLRPQDVFKDLNSILNYIKERNNNQPQTENLVSKKLFRKSMTLKGPLKKETSKTIFCLLKQ